MRRFLLTTTLLALSTANSFAQGAPAFRPLDSSMTAGSATAPAAAPAAPAFSNIKQAAEPTPQATLPKAHDGEVIDSVGSGAIPSLPLEVQTENGISYLSGGISDEETDQLKSQQEAYNLRLLLTGVSGEFLGGATMTLKDAAGKTLLSISEAGPEVYVQVPAGKYVVDVTNAAGASKSTHLTVPAKGAVKTQIRV